MASFPRVSPLEPYAHLFPPPYVPHAPPTSFFLIYIYICIYYLYLSTYRICVCLRAVSTHTVEGTQEMSETNGRQWIKRKGIRAELEICYRKTGVIKSYNKDVQEEGKRKGGVLRHKTKSNKGRSRYVK